MGWGQSCLGFPEGLLGTWAPLSPLEGRQALSGGQWGAAVEKYF